MGELPGQRRVRSLLRAIWTLLNHQVAGGIAVYVIVAIVAAIGGLVFTRASRTPPSTPKTFTRTVHVPSAKCPDTLRPMALVQTPYPVANSHPVSTGGLGSAHIDNVIAPDGSANVKKFETVCLTVLKYPAASRQLWLILRIREPAANGGNPYDLYFVVSALADPFPGRYSVAVDRSCTALTAGQRHTLFVISAPASAAPGLWHNYNAWLRSLNTNCNNHDDSNRHHLPEGYYIASDPRPRIAR